MKLALNDEFLSLQSNHELVSKIKEATSLLIKEYGDRNGSIVLEWNQSFITRAKDDRGRMIYQYPAQKSTMLLSEYMSDKTQDMGYLSLRLYETMKSINNIKQFQPKKIPFKGRMIINKKDIELMFFMVFANPHCAKIPGPLSKYQITSGKKQEPWFYVYSEVKKADVSIEKTQKKARVQYLLTTDDSGVKISDSDISTLGYIFGMTNPGKSDIKVVRKFLLDLTEGPKADENISKLLDHITDKDKLAVNSVIQTAKQNKVIELKNTVGKGKQWSYIDQNGNTTDMIIKVPSNSHPEQLLLTYLLKTPDALARLKTEIGL